MDWLKERNFRLRVSRRQIDKNGNPVPREPAALEDEKARFLATAMPALIGSATTKFSRSYIGGLPLLPMSVPWPTVDDRPLVFACQIDLAALPRTNAFNWLPANGFLFYFVGQSDFDDFANPIFHVLHVGHVTDKERESPIIEKKPYPRVNLTFEVAQTYNVNFGATVLQWQDQNDFDAWQSKINAAQRGSTRWQIGGWPNDLQSNQYMSTICERKYRNLDKHDYTTVKQADFVQALTNWRYIGWVDRQGLDDPWAPYFRGYFWVRINEAVSGDFSHVCFFPQSD